jgi:hypothetical protein
MPLSARHTVTDDAEILRLVRGSGTVEDRTAEPATGKAR